MKTKAAGIRSSTGLASPNGPLHERTILARAAGRQGFSPARYLRALSTPHDLSMWFLQKGARILDGSSGCQAHKSRSFQVFLGVPSAASYWLKQFRVLPRFKIGNEVKRHTATASTTTQASDIRANTQASSCPILKWGSSVLPTPVLPGQQAWVVL
jgi:hypothetical protein